MEKGEEQRGAGGINYLPLCRSYLLLKRSLGFPGLLHEASLIYVWEASLKKRL